MMTPPNESRTVQGRTYVWLLVATLVAAMHATAHAKLTPLEKCALLKNKAAAKKITAKLKCHQKSIQLHLAVDPVCLTTAETKFDDAIAKAEALGGCAVPGDGAAIESAVDACVDSIVTLTPDSSTTNPATTSTTTTTTVTSTTSTTVPVPAVCCVDQTGTCTYESTVQACRNRGPGSNDGPSGSVCTAFGCSTFPNPGDCCQMGGPQCFTGSFAIEFCAAEGGQVVHNTICMPNGQ